MAYLVIILISYLLGSVPWGLLLVRLVWRKDVRQFGSGNVGATNVLRTVGVLAGVLVLALDAGKAALAVLLGRLLIGGPVGDVIAGSLAVVGHNWSVFLRFKGGRGIAPAAGAMLVIAPLATAVGAGLFLLTAAVSRYVSLASLVGVASVVVALGIWALVDYYSVLYFVYGMGLGAILVVRHRGNILRLLKGTERRLGERAERRSGGASL